VDAMSGGFTEGMLCEKGRFVMSGRRISLAAVIFCLLASNLVHAGTYYPSPKGFKYTLTANIKDGSIIKKNSPVTFNVIAVNLIIE
jgi:ABC-type transporter Mla subunit MlaD